MRRVAGIVLWIVATAAGVFGLGWFDLAGLGWSNGFFARYYWDASESVIGVAFGVVALLIWLALLFASFAVLRGGVQSHARADRRLAGWLTVLSIAVLVVVWVLMICRPELPSEFPTPPWNRA